MNKMFAVVEIFDIKNLPVIAILLAIPAVSTVLCALAALMGNSKTVRVIAKLSSWLTLFWTVLMYANYSSDEFSYRSQHDWWSAIGSGWNVGVDGISIAAISLTAFVFVVVMHERFGEARRSNFYIWMLLMQVGTLGAFVSLDLLMFFAFFELVLVPVLFLMIANGTTASKRAGLIFYIYTFTGSIFFLIGAFVLATHVGDSINLDFFLIKENLKMSTDSATAVFVLMAIAFAVKVPLVPLHSWLRELYSHAPLSVIALSSAVLIKLGAYGFLRFCIELLPETADYLSPVLATLAVIAIVYGALVAIAQKDIRLLAGYSTIAHMGFVVLGAFSLTSVGITGSVILMVAHGVIALGLILIASHIHEKTGTFLIGNSIKLQKKAPVLAAFSLIIIFASIGVPGLAGFVGEFTVLAGSIRTLKWWTVVSLFGVIAGAVYMLTFYQRVFHGDVGENTDVENTNDETVTDISIWQKVVLVPVIVVLFVIGLYPGLLSKKVEPTANRIATKIAIEGNSAGFSISGGPALVEQGSEKEGK